MKTIILSIIISVFTLINVNSQTIENKDWFITTVDLNGKKMNYYQHIMFKTDGYAQLEGKVFGRWEYLKADKTIRIESRMVKEFSGIWTITKLTNKELVIKLDEAQMYMELYNKKQIVSENEKSNLFGVWYINTYDGDREYYKFEKPDKCNSTTASLNKVGGGKSGGVWFYNSKEKTLIIPNRYMFISGTSTIKKASENKIMLKHEKGDITLNKVIELNNNKDIMPLKVTADFFTQRELIKNKELLQKTIYKFEDSETNTNANFLEKIKKLIYNKKMYIKDFNTFSEFPFTIEIDNNKSYYNIFRGFGASNLKKNNYLYPIKEAGTFDEITQFSDTEITIEAGKFLCSVFYVEFKDINLLLYMIKNKPGVYAKIIVTEENYNNEIENTVYELSKIE